jgi:GT2 family glycosyltransferase
LIDLSVIIVNYNVQHFLEQCLNSVYRAAGNHSVEVFVVDNNSVDGSLQMIAKRFTEVQLIANKNNVGFSRANNQAMRSAKGRYVLLLNPDTLVAEDTFDHCIKFMDEHPKAGAMGVKMVDGKGDFLPESKRGLPTPMVAFYKVFGLSSLFPKSRRFGRYHLGYLSEDETHSVDILAGAFMFMRKETLDKVGLLDEDFFMYGEDIDLSWRIKLGGYENYYYPHTQIIHYKGESTKKSSINYVLVFYNAMIIFARKHFSKSNAGIFAFLIKGAIYLRASFSLLRRLLSAFIFPALDFVFTYLSFIAVALLYQQYRGISFPDMVYWKMFPFLSALMVVISFFHGGYDRPTFIRNVLRGGMVSVISVFVLYAFLPESLRFSRFVVLSGSTLGLFSMVLIKWIIHLNSKKKHFVFRHEGRRIAIIGKTDGVIRVRGIIDKAVWNPEVVLEVYPNYVYQNKKDHFVTNLSRLEEAINLFRLNEIIYCSEDMNSEEIIREMIRLDNPSLEFRISPANSNFIIGSQSISTSTDLFHIPNLNNIHHPRNRRSKKLLDFSTSILVLFFSPVLTLFGNNFKYLIINAIRVVGGRNTWVGFEKIDTQAGKLPALLPGILSTASLSDQHENSTHHLEQINMEYAEKYSLSKDGEIIMKNLRSLGRPV